MTAFFVAGVSEEGAEEAYRELRTLSQRFANCPARPRRIFRLRCRLYGHDEEIEVGKIIPCGDGIVTAILDHGREEAFMVHRELATGESIAPLRVSNPVYGVTEFSA